jgi:type IV secretory pathway TrbL component
MLKSKTISDSAKIRRRELIFHIVGISTLSGAVFLQCLVFFDISTQGYFVAVERNLGILLIEIVVTFFLVMYLVLFYIKFLRYAGALGS